MASTLAKTETGIGKGNTKIWEENGVYRVLLHQTLIYTEDGNSITLNNGGWVTPTTVRRMNQVLIRRGHGGDVAIRKGQMVRVVPGGVLPFIDGKITINKGA